MKLRDAAEGSHRTIGYQLMRQLRQSHCLNDQRVVRGGADRPSHRQKKRESAKLGHAGMGVRFNHDVMESIGHLSPAEARANYHRQPDNPKSRGQYSGGNHVSKGKLSERAVLGDARFFRGVLTRGRL